MVAVLSRSMYINLLSTRLPGTGATVLMFKVAWVGEKVSCCPVAGPKQTPESLTSLPTPGLPSQPCPATPPQVPSLSSIYISSRVPTLAASSQSTDHTERTGAWSSGFGRRVNGGGFQQPKCLGSTPRQRSKIFHKNHRKVFVTAYLLSTGEGG